MDTADCLLYSKKLQVVIKISNTYELTGQKGKEIITGRYKMSPCSFGEFFCNFYNYYYLQLQTLFYLLINLSFYAHILNQCIRGG